MIQFRLIIKHHALNMCCHQMYLIIYYFIKRMYNIHMFIYLGSLFFIWATKILKMVAHNSKQLVSIPGISLYLYCYKHCIKVVIEVSLLFIVYLLFSSTIIYEIYIVDLSYSPRRRCAHWNVCVPPRIYFLCPLTYCFHTCILLLNQHDPNV